MSGEFITPKKSKTFKPSSEEQQNAVEYFERIVDVTQINKDIEKIPESKEVCEPAKKGKKEKKLVDGKKKKNEKKNKNKTSQQKEAEFEKELESLVNYKKEQAEIEKEKRRDMIVPIEIVSENETKTDFSSLNYTHEEIHELFTSVFNDIHHGLKQLIVNPK